MRGLQILFKIQQLNKAMHSIFSKHEQKVFYFEQHENKRPFNFHQ